MLDNKTADEHIADLEQQAAGLRFALSEARSAAQKNLAEWSKAIQYYHGVEDDLKSQLADAKKKVEFVRGQAQSTLQEYFHKVERALHRGDKWALFAITCNLNRREWREEAIEALTDEVEQNCGEGHMDDGTPLFCDMALSRYEYAIRKLCELGIMRLYGEQPQRYCFVDKGVTVAK